MEKHLNRPVSRRLHPLVNAAIAGLALWYVLSVWIGFSGSSYTDYLLAIASLFVLAALALPLIAWGVWRANRRLDAGRDEPGTFREWANDFRNWSRGEFETGQGRVKSMTATVEILLPIAAVAFGMTAFAIVALVAG